ncbi:hypothetical protein SAMN04489864_10171 [Pedobacter insulae]|uniref:Uncharacterized protein n=2 Tax=Pedobacter insulae TaxID=414048 RepID=A0A1I2T2Q5_9SPHI|nr:hypothetical protein SAMN04489864_10171 [Pedobacter insulae]
MFNFFANRDGYNSLTHVLAGAVTVLCLITVVLNFVSLLSLIVNFPLNIPFGKGGKVLLALFSMIVGYFVLFSIFKFSKNGENKSLFSLRLETTRLVWIFFTGNFVILILLSFGRMYYFQ